MNGDGGFVVKAGGLLNARYSGSVIADGGTIRIKSGGQLRTTFNGRVVARNGGKVILEDGAKVQLWGGDPDEGDGTLWIRAGGELVIDGDYEFSGNGFFQFDAGNTVSGDGALRIIGDGDQHRRMQVNNSARVRLEGGQDFYVRDAAVVYASGASVEVEDGSGVSVRDADFRGPAQIALATDGSASFLVNDCDFLGNRRAIDFYRAPGVRGRTTTIYSSRFTNCDEGVLVNGSSTVGTGTQGPHPFISASVFEDCEMGVFMENYPRLTISGSRFTSTVPDAIAIDALTVGTLQLRSNTVTGYASASEPAVILEGVELCDVIGGTYSNNETAFKLRGEVDLRLSACARLAANDFGVFVSRFGSARIQLAGADFHANGIGIKGGDVTLTATPTNTFVLGTGRLFDFNPVGPLPMDLNRNSWSGGPTTNGVPSPGSCGDWFNFGRDLGCNSSVVATVAGTGCVGCESPEVCPEFCFLYPDHPLCPQDGGVKQGGDGERQRHLTVYPNPASDRLVATGGPAGQGQLRLRDLTGRTLRNLVYTDGQYVSLDIATLAPGIYVLELRADAAGEEMRTARIVKR